ncbi:hypothetical protein [Corticibacter populi]|nr:hypothetical protein [Corticibacter populi]
MMRGSGVISAGEASGMGMTADSKKIRVAEFYSLSEHKKFEA